MSPEVSLSNIFLAPTERKGPKRLTPAEHAKGEIKQTISPKIQNCATCDTVSPQGQRTGIMFLSEVIQ